MIYFQFFSLKSLPLHDILANSCKKDCLAGFGYNLKNKKICLVL
jgi:hypothetical protein